MKKQKLRKIRPVISFFIGALLISGITAIPLEWELAILTSLIDASGAMGKWLGATYVGIKELNDAHPFLAYGFDWLAFAHIILAILFIGPLRDPVKNVWVIKFGIIACILVVPFALIMGPFREIPLFWQLIDCSFGVIGVLPLLWVLNQIKKLDYENAE
ncbi:MAG: hypothetical protein MRY83_14660 [Flavobacteriales bacterium]|nr:hypothetical protein [Flavobacteriales bacterium]